MTFSCLFLAWFVLSLLFVIVPCASTICDRGALITRLIGITKIYQLNMMNLTSDLDCPIKYIENNLVFNQEGECFAYYELIPYNYSFLSPEQKYQLHDNFRQLIAQNREGKIHALCDRK